MGMTIRERIESVISRRLRIANDTIRWYEEAFGEAQDAINQKNRELDRLRGELREANEKNCQLNARMRGIVGEVEAANREIHAYDIAWQKAVEIIEQMPKTFYDVPNKQNSD